MAVMFCFFKMLELNYDQVLFVENVGAVYISMELNGDQFHDHFAHHCNRVTRHEKPSGLNLISVFFFLFENLEADAKNLLSWIKYNGLKANPDKFHLLLSDTGENFSINVDGFDIPNSLSQKPLGITIDNKMSFKLHLTNIVLQPARNYTASHV